MHAAKEEFSAGGLRGTLHELRGERRGSLEPDGAVRDFSPLAALLYFQQVNQERRKVTAERPKFRNWRGPMKLTKSAGRRSQRPSRGDVSYPPPHAVGMASLSTYN